MKYLSRNLKANVNVLVLLNLIVRGSWRCHVMRRQIIVFNIWKGPLLAKQKTAEKYCLRFCDCVIYACKTSESDIFMLILAIDRRLKSANEFLHGVTVTASNALSTIWLLLVIRIYAMQQIDVSFLCFCPLIDYQLRHNTVKVVVAARGSAVELWQCYDEIVHQ